MSKLFIHFLNADQVAAIKSAGHELETFAGGEIDKLVVAAKEKFPDLVAHIEKGIADAKDPNTKGIDKLEAVAEDAIPAIVEAMGEFPNIKDFAIQMTSSVFNDGLSELETVATHLIHDIFS